MHTFQPYPIDMLDINPFTKLSKEWALVTAGDKEKSNTMTVSWGGTGVLWGKNVAYHILMKQISYSSVARWLLYLLKRLHLQTKPLCVNGTAITICTLCMLVKLLRLRLANFIAILRNEVSICMFVRSILRDEKNPNIYLCA